MARPVQRDELVDYVTYASEIRPTYRKRMVEEVKPVRRIHLGEHVTFLFENHDTVLYQVQEMMRVETIVRESDIQHELTTYNELLGKPGELGCTMLIEIDDEAQRAVKLAAWLPLVSHLYAELEDGTRKAAQFDERQVGDDRLSSVQYLTFPVGGACPVAIGCSFELYDVRHALTAAELAALTSDLNE